MNRYLVVGWGSMGKRRCKILRDLGYNVHAYDLDTVNMAMDKIYFVSDKCLSEIFNMHEYDGVFICSPPLSKQHCIELCNKYNIIPFIETDIIAYSGKYVPSRSMIYHPAVKKIKELLKQLGKVYTFNYHCGMHIDEWRDGNRDIWQTKKETGGCRELFVFEVSWLSWLFGIPIEAKGIVNRTLDIEADTVYSTVVGFGKSDTVTGNILINMVSKPAIRELHIIGENGVISWNRYFPFICYEDTDGNNITYETESGIPESIYIEETIDYMSGNYKYTQTEETEVIRMLKEVENV